MVHLRNNIPNIPVGNTNILASQLGILLLLLCGFCFVFVFETVVHVGSSFSGTVSKDHRHVSTYFFVFLPDRVLCEFIILLLLYSSVMRLQLCTTTSDTISLVGVCMWSSVPETVVYICCHSNTSPSQFL